MFFRDPSFGQVPPEYPNPGEKPQPGASPEPDLRVYSVNGGPMTIDDIKGVLVKPNPGLSDEPLSKKEKSRITLLMKTPMGDIIVPLSSHPDYK